ncbi:hypothetical protein C1645_837758 [Glomus cerebriforme]|uniref:BTB domain-containing protein n=1 Tax=Glomus cerebriforme TaxID=658196 RepID=A0A397S899_9GLOM|nr:hypothetical protein C1645_837758 [Glomus cerebriforme]
MDYQTLTDTLLNDISSLYNGSDDYNIKMQIGEGSKMEVFEAYSVILRARSTYFRLAFSSDWNLWTKSAKLKTELKSRIEELEKNKTDPTAENVRRENNNIRSTQNSNLSQDRLMHPKASDLENASNNTFLLAQKYLGEFPKHNITLTSHKMHLLHNGPYNPNRHM